MIQSKTPTRSNLTALLDIIMLGLGVLFGGLVALMSLWLWFDYQTNPADSFLAILNARFMMAVPTPLGEFFGYEAQQMGLPLTGQTQAFWYMARAGGIVAYLLLWLSTLWGLILSTKIANDLVPASIAYGLHEFLSIGAVLFSGVHSLVLLGDSYIEFNIFHLIIPFTAPYEPIWTGLGTIGFYLTATLTGSFYVRKQIGQKVWRTLHYLTFIAYLLALIHGLAAGTDTELMLMKLIYLGTGFTVLFLIYYRLLSLKLKVVKS